MQDLMANMMLNMFQQSMQGAFHQMIRAPHASGNVALPGLQLQQTGPPSVMDSSGGHTSATGTASPCLSVNMSSAPARPVEPAAASSPCLSPAGNVLAILPPSDAQRAGAQVHATARDSAVRDCKTTRPKRNPTRKRELLM